MNELILGRPEVRRRILVPKECEGFTRAELIVVIIFVLLLALIFLSGPGGGVGRKSDRIQCVKSRWVTGACSRQVNRGFRI